MGSPPSVQKQHPVKLIFVGGFLGSGKTTALAALAKRLISQGKKIGIITNDQSQNLVDTVIVRQMLEDLGVPVKEVVKGCFCCRFDDLIHEMETIMTHQPDIMMGEPVGSCTDFVAAVANPIKIHYKDAFRFAPFCTMVDPDRVGELLLKETRSDFPEDVAYLFHKQLEEADVIVLNKIDLISTEEVTRLTSALEDRFEGKSVLPVSAKSGRGLEPWLDLLLSARPGANTVLRQIDYDRYARAEAVLGWLNGAVTISAAQPADPRVILATLAGNIQARLKTEEAEVGHLKFVCTSGGKSMWANLTHLTHEPTLSEGTIPPLTHGSVIVNARVKIEPEALEALVRDALETVLQSLQIEYEILDLQCFSPAYPDPPHLIREPVETDTEFEEPP